ncbi:MAG: hypothetical protein K0M40_05135 [Prolixibacteraceae bacterium]|nr:hypothetical protein [Prolixibacteraceae bacterium]
MKKYFLFALAVLFAVLQSNGKQTIEILETNIANVGLQEQEFRVNGYKKGINGWEKVPLKIKVIQPSFGEEKIEIISYDAGFQWIEIIGSIVSKVNKSFDGEVVAEKYEYKCSCLAGYPVYFNF